MFSTLYTFPTCDVVLQGIILEDFELTIVEAHYDIMELEMGEIVS